jgi:DNA-binding Lrp family transcriptional regulator
VHPLNIRKIIVADREDGMTVKAISRAVRVSESAIYRLFQKIRKTGTIKTSYQMPVFADRIGIRADFLDCKPIIHANSPSILFP